VFRYGSDTAEPTLNKCILTWHSPNFYNSALANTLVFQILSGISTHTKPCMQPFNTRYTFLQCKGGRGVPRYLSLPLYGFSLSGSFIIQQWHHILHIFDNSTQSIKCTTQLTVQVTSQALHTEPVFVNLFRCPGIDSQSGGPVRQPYFFVPGRRAIHRLAE